MGPTVSQLSGSKSKRMRKDHNSNEASTSHHNAKSTSGAIADLSLGDPKVWCPEIQYIGICQIFPDISLWFKTKYFFLKFCQNFQDNFHDIVLLEPSQKIRSQVEAHDSFLGLLIFPINLKTTSDLISNNCPFACVPIKSIRTYYAVRCHNCSQDTPCMAMVKV